MHGWYADHKERLFGTWGGSKLLIPRLEVLLHTTARSFGTCKTDEHYMETV